MGKKALLSCVACGSSFKKRLDTVTQGERSRHAFCSTTCSALGPNATACSLGVGGYGDVPPAFGGAGVPRAARADTSDADVSDGGGHESASKTGTDKRSSGKRRKKKTKKGTRDGAHALNQRPVETDPACVKILAILDEQTSILTSPGIDLDRALSLCVSSDLLAVDLEGVSMSRRGAVTLLQVAVAEKVFLFDVQALSTEDLFLREVSPKTTTGRSKSLKDVLEDVSVTKLMFDCRVDSDALFHQHGVALAGVFDVQLADVAARRRRSFPVPHLSGMPKCAMRHLTGSSGATASSLAALDAEPERLRRVSVSGANTEAEAVIRVTEFLKTKVKASYAPDRGGDERLWALRPIGEDARRYAALDVWLLLKIQEAMVRDDALDDTWRGRVVEASKQRETEYRSLAKPILQFRDPERAVAPDL
jgi:exonuclease 3'-5' domain-containing protein 1